MDAHSCPHHKSEIFMEMSLNLGPGKLAEQAGSMANLGAVSFLPLHICKYMTRAAERDPTPVAEEQGPGCKHHTAKASLVSCARGLPSS